MHTNQFSYRYAMSQVLELYNRLAPKTRHILILAYVTFWATIGITLASVQPSADTMLLVSSMHRPVKEYIITIEKPHKPNPHRGWRQNTRIVAPKPKPKLVVASTPPNANAALGKALAAKRGWTGANWNALNRLWSHESGWDIHNYGPMLKDGRACGIPQKYPCGGLDALDARGQIMWGLDYIAGRYGNPSNANAHSLRTGWY